MGPFVINSFNVILLWGCCCRGVVGVLWEWLGVDRRRAALPAAEGDAAALPGPAGRPPHRHRREDLQPGTATQNRWVHPASVICAHSWMKVIYATASVMRAKFLSGSYISTHAASLCEIHIEFCLKSFIYSRTKQLNCTSSVTFYDFIPGLKIWADDTLHLLSWTQIFESILRTAQCKVKNECSILTTCCNHLKFLPHTKLMLFSLQDSRGAIWSWRT